MLVMIGQAYWTVVEIDEAQSGMFETRPHGKMIQQFDRVNRRLNSFSKVPKGEALEVASNFRAHPRLKSPH